MRKILWLRERYAHSMTNGTLEPSPGSTQNRTNTVSFSKTTVKDHIKFSEINDVDMKLI